MVIARVVHDDPACRICRVTEPGIVATAGPLPPPYPNPAYSPKGQLKGRSTEGGPRGQRWFHGCAWDPEDDPEEHDRLRAPDTSGSEYGERAAHHWNTDLGVHFTSLHHVAEDHFAAKGGVSPDSRIAHATLHMRNPIHFTDEAEFAHHAVSWAHQAGHRYLPESHEAHEAFRAEDFDAVSDLDPKERDYSYHGDVGADPRVGDIDHRGPGTHPQAAHETWLAHHPDREEITSGYQDHLRHSGHDGVIYGNTFEGPHKHKCAIAFPQTPVGIHHWEWLHPSQQHRNPSEGEKRPAQQEHPDDPNQLKLFGKTAAIRMVPPEEYRNFRYPDYPRATTPEALAQHFQKTSPEYYDTVKKDVQENGFTTPVLVRWHDPRGQLLRRPQVMEGHHRAAVAHELGLHLPVGDYDEPGDYDAAAQAGQSWWRENQRPTGDMPRTSSAEDWSFQHFQPGAKGHRMFGGPAHDPRRHMVEYSVEPNKKIKLDGTFGLDRVREQGGPEAHDRMRQAIFAQHPGHQEYDPVADAPPPPKEKPKIYYHGTTVPDVTHILPASQHHGPVTFPHATDPEHAYASLSKADAWHYAEMAHHVTGEKPRVYQVRPIGGHGNVEVDPAWDDARDESRGNFASDRRSTHGFKVVRELSTPQKIHDSFDWPGKDDGE